MRLSVIEGSLAQAVLNWTTGSVLIGYMLYLGATPTQLGMVASLPLLAQAASPLAAWMVSRFGRRKLMAIVCASLGRTLWVLAALTPQLGLPAGSEPAFLLGIVLVASVFLACNGTIWSSWMADVVPADRRGAYFGPRTGIMGLFGMVMNLAAGALLDRMAAPLGFQVVLFTAVACGVACVILYLFHYDPPVEQPRVTFAKIVSTPIRDANFRRFLIFAVYWQFTVMLAAPFVLPYFLDELGMTFTQVAIWTAIAASCGLGTTIYWGRTADRVGNKPVLAIGTFLAGAALPASWILAGVTGRLGFIWVGAVFDAVAWGAIGPAIFNLALGSAAPASRLAYMGMYSLATGAAGFLGGALSGPLLVWFSGLAGFAAGGYWMLFILSGVGRALAWVFLGGISEPNSWATRALLSSYAITLRSLRPPWRP